jgi:hypothetical protein
MEFYTILKFNNNRDRKGFISNYQNNHTSIIMSVGTHKKASEMK